MKFTYHCKEIYLAILILALGWAQASYAQTDALPASAALAKGGDKPTPPGGIPVGPLIAYPSLDLSVGYNGNLFSSNINKQGSTQYGVNANLKFEGSTGPHKYDVTLAASHTTYADSASDSFTNYSIAGNAALVLSGRSRLKLHAESRYGVDPRGSTDRGGATAPDEYVNQSAEGVFSYGAAGAKGRIEIDGGMFTRRYLNNRATTEVSDRNSDQLGATFLWRIAPKTELLVLAQHRSVDYLLPTSTQDSTEMRYQFGAKWDATAKTAGIVKFGLLEKKFASGGRTGFSGSSWDAGVRWSPLTYSVWDFNTSKSTNESTGTGDFLLTQNYGVNWNHAWNSRFSTGVSTGWRQDQFLGTGGGRVDKTSTLGFKVSYQWRRWLRFGGAYTLTNRVSDPSATDFTRQMILFTVGATL